MNKRLMTLIALPLIALALIVGACAPAAPSPAPATPTTPADFYAKNVVTLIVPFAPGGGTDYGGRTFAAFWPDVTGGAMVVKNMTAGSGMEAMNYLWTAKPDGLTIALQVHANSATWWLNNDPAMKHEYNKFQFIGYFLDDPFMFTTAPRLAGKSIKDLQQMKGLKFATTSVPSWWQFASALVIEIFKLDAKLIPGFLGSADSGVAMGRGEIDGMSNVSSSINEQIPKMANKPLMALGNKRSPLFPDVPTILELATLTPEQDRMFKLLNTFYSGKVIITPRDVPTDKIKFLRDSFDKLLANQGYQRQYGVRWTFKDAPIKGEDFTREVDTLFKTPEDLKASVRQIIDKYTTK